MPFGFGTVVFQDFAFAFGVFDDHLEAHFETAHFARQFAAFRQHANDGGIDPVDLFAQNFKLWSLHHPHQYCDQVHSIVLENSYEFLSYRG